MIKGEEKNNDGLKKKEAEAFKHDRLFNVQSEMILLGNVINRLELVDDYHGCLQESDFYDLNNQQVWQFLCEYYRKYGTDWDATKVNGLHTFMKLEGEKVFPATKKGTRICTIAPIPEAWHLWPGGQRSIQVCKKTVYAQKPL